MQWLSNLIKSGEILMIDFVNCWATEHAPLINLARALLPVLLTIFAIYIAFQQYLTNRRKLKLELFDKRFSVFQATKEFIQGVIISSSYKQKNQNSFHVKYARCSVHFW